MSFYGGVMPNLLNQICAFLLTLLIGILLGIIIHFYQLTVRKSRLRKILLIMMDFSLWILLIALIFFGLVLINLGELRVYVFVALIIGVLIYYRYGARHLHRPLAALARVVVICFSWLKHQLAKPFIKMGKALHNYYTRKAEEAEPPDI
ncbi:MAG: spore cortex biosynthesis protein YabQ [Syntrophomonadaceae bacterium]